MTITSGGRMIISTVRIHGRADKRKEILQTLRGLTETLVDRDGCLGAELFRDLENRDTLYVVERWRSQRDLIQHRQSRTMAVLRGLESLLVEAIEVQHAVKM